MLGIRLLSGTKKGGEGVKNRRENLREPPQRERSKKTVLGDPEGGD